MLKFERHVKDYFCDSNGQRINRSIETEEGTDQFKTERNQSTERKWRYPNNEDLVRVESKE